MKPRQNLYLDKDLSERLDRLAQKPGTSKSAIIADALRVFLEHRAAHELDDKLKPRLDKVTAQMNRLERNQRVIIESLALYIRFQFSVLPPLPERDQAAALALAQERFQAFIDQVGRRVAGGRETVTDAFHSTSTRSETPQ
ncbi:MAG: ribbon-helix-helix protein, CopG family [Alphaproteobacteria bacterium]|nr:ribbon-helix-helix protein, CopG family [Alphaproteobacteria bacterium]